MREELHPFMLQFHSEDELVMLYTRQLGASLAVPPYEGDCGLDLVTSEDATIYEGQDANIPHGVSIALPDSTFGLILARSSTWIRYGLLVVPAVIDQGWRGELFTRVFRPSRGNRMDGGPTVPQGTRLSQLVVLPNLAANLVLSEVQQLPSSQRGERGFGSSGH